MDITIGTVGLEPTPPASKADALPLRHVPGLIVVTERDRDGRI
jgi:hypothetical protein